MRYISLKLPLWKYTRALAFSTDSLRCSSSHGGRDHRNLQKWGGLVAVTKES